MGEKQESKTYKLSEKQFEEVVLQVGILNEMYSRIKEDRSMNLFQKKVLLKNKTQNSLVLKELEEIFEKNQ